VYSITITFENFLFILTYATYSTGLYFHRLERYISVFTSLTLLISSLSFFLIITKLDFKNLVSLLPHLPFFTLRFKKLMTTRAL